MNAYSRFIEREYADFEDFNQNYKPVVPDGFNYTRDVIDVYAAEEPNRIALVWCDDAGREKSFTFGELAAEVDRACAMFRGLGLQKGDVVMSVLRRRYEYWITTLALCKLGCVLIPATNLLMQKDIEYRCNAAGVRMIISVVQDELLDQMEKALFSCPTVEFLMTVDGHRDNWLNWDECIPNQLSIVNCALSIKNTDPMLIYFTSGTTGMPKMVLHDFTYPLGHLPTGVYWHRLDETDLHLTVADSGWAKCSWGKIYGQWLAGAAIFVYDMEKFVPLKLLEMVARYKITSFCAPPTVYRYILKEDWAGLDLSALKKASTAGEPLNPSVYEEFLEKTGVPIREAFGQTETGVICGMFMDLPTRVASVGKPNPQYTVALLDDDGNICPPGEEGEICIKWGEDGGAGSSGKHPLGVLVEYYRDDKQTNAAIYDGWYHTGDNAWADEDGYYWFIGRGDDIIKSSGYRIGPFEVESALISHPAVVECAITGVPHPDRGQVIKATVVLASGYDGTPELIKELQNHVKKTTAPYKYPRIIEFVPELPKTFSGKIKRKQIRTEDAGD